MLSWTFKLAAYKERQDFVAAKSRAMLFRHHARGCGQTLDINLAAPSAGNLRSPLLLSFSGGQDRPKGTEVIGQGAARCFLCSCRA